ncbi:hypothetical protein RF240_21675 [Dickeya dadantii]|uniref:hypothetical protein n=1 Tax=Dickeya dadantii TaxID=204038 RepID=UPI0035A8A20E
MNQTEQRIFDLVRSELTDDLLPKPYRGLVNSKFCGHCHHASLAMYNLLGGRAKGYKLQKAIDEDNITHYWLVNENNEIIDPTAEQYSELERPFPYHLIKNNRASYRLTKATNRIISNVKAKLGESI